MPESHTHELRDVRGDPRFILMWLTWWAWTILLLGLFFGAVYLSRRSPASLIIGASLIGVILPVVVYSLRLARRGNNLAALWTGACMMWLLALIIAARGSTALAATLPLILFPAILAVPYTARRGLFRIAGAALAVCAVAAWLSASGPLLPSTLSEETLGIIVAPIVFLLTALALVGLWHVGSRLRESLGQTQAANRVLAESERSLERKVEERTAELARQNLALERALVEISDVHSIAATANSTLDLDRVLDLVMSAVEKILPFDVLGVGLIDGNRLKLEHLRGSEALGQIQSVEIPLAETQSSFIHVVRNHQPFFMNQFPPGVAAAMSPTDRMLYETGGAQTLLICPLEVQEEVIGMIVFNNTRESFALDRTDIDSVRRYVTHVSTALRNARLFEESRVARAAAIESSQAKSQFLANVSHELRTPLTTIIGYSEMLAEEVEDSGQTDFLSDLGHIQSSGRHLLDLVNDVLDLSKVEAGKMDLSLEHCDVRDLVEEIVESVQPLALQQDNRLEVGDLQGLGSAYTDVTKLRQALLNLLSNASKFTEHGTVGFGASRARQGGADWLTFRVSDSGIGMTAAQCARIFEPFVQAETSTAGVYGGTGLGLAITREVSGMLGGWIEVKSAVGEGSTFTVRIPADANAGAAVADEATSAGKETDAEGIGG